MWIGRGAPLLGLAGRTVTEEQMRALFGHGAHPDQEAIIDRLPDGARARRDERQQLERVRDEAIAAARLGRAFPAYQTLEQYDTRVQRGWRRSASRRGGSRPQPRRRGAGGGGTAPVGPRSPGSTWSSPRSSPPRCCGLWTRASGSATPCGPRTRPPSREALALVEEHAALTRTGRGGIAQIQTSGLIAAAFEHWDSRAGDPNLHTHVAVSSKVQGADGKWRALDARLLYAMKVAASETYNTAFEAHLTASLGVTFTARPDTTGGREPVREITGIPPG